MLEALTNLENNDGGIPAHAWNLCQAAISKAISSANVKEHAPPLAGASVETGGDA
jgi:hypothetical protein